MAAVDGGHRVRTLVAMRMALVVVMASALCGCANRYVNGGALAASTVLLACDALETYRASASNWHMSGEETNPILGRRPNPGIVVSYFATVMAVNFAAWMLTPAEYRGIAPLGVVAIEANTLSGNDPRVSCTR